MNTTTSEPITKRLRSTKNLNSNSNSDSQINKKPKEISFSITPSTIHTHNKSNLESKIRTKKSDKTEVKDIRNKTTITAKNSKPTSNETKDIDSKECKTKTKESVTKSRKEHKKEIIKQGSDFDSTSIINAQPKIPLSQDAPSVSQSDKTSLSIHNQHINLLSKITEQVNDNHNDKSTQPNVCYEEHTQTDIDGQTWTNMRDGFINKICEQDLLISDLRSQIETLEALLGEATNFQPVNQPVLEPGISPRPPSPTDSITSCYIIGDSHVRGIRENLNQFIPKSCKITSFFQPGAGFHEVAQAQIKSPGLMNSNTLDSVIVFCGTNDIGVAEWETTKQALDDLTDKFQLCKHFYMIGVPLRFNHKKMNFHIIRFNTKLRNYVASKLGKTFTFIDPTRFLKPRNYAIDGLHLNKLGKEKLAKKIFTSMSKNYSFHSTKSKIQNRTTIHTNPNIPNHVLPRPCLPSTPPAFLSQTPITPGLTFIPNNTEGRFSVTPQNFPNISHSESTFTNYPIPTIPNPNSTNSYYRITQKSINTTYPEDNNPMFYSTPIPRVEPGYNRTPLENFQETGPISTT